MIAMNREDAKRQRPGVQAMKRSRNAGVARESHGSAAWRLDRAVSHEEWEKLLASADGAVLCDLAALHMPTQKIGVLVRRLETTFKLGFEAARKGAA